MDAIGEHAAVNEITAIFQWGKCPIFFKIPHYESAVFGYGWGRGRGEIDTEDGGGRIKGCDGQCPGARAAAEVKDGARGGRDWSGQEPSILAGDPEIMLEGKAVGFGLGGHE